MPTVELSMGQLAHTLQGLAPEEFETLEIMLNPELSKELKKRWETGKREFVQGKTISENELFKEEQCML